MQSSADSVKRDVENPILGPILEIEMPPFRLGDGESLGLHGFTQQIPKGGRFRRSTRIRGKGALREFIISAGHLHLRAAGQLEQADVDSAATIVPRTFLRVGDKLYFPFGSGC